MARLVYAPGFFDDLERFEAHLKSHGVANIQERLTALVNALEVLSESPHLGKPSGAGKRELVIGRGASGYVVLYREVRELDMVLILAARHQRKDGYNH